MELRLNEEQRLLVDTFARFFANESTLERVREAEATSGFDAKLWQQLVELGCPGIRVAAAHGGAAMSLRCISLVAQEAGRQLVSAPLVDSSVVATMLSRAGGDEALRCLARLLEGSSIVTVALEPVETSAVQVVSHGAVADAIIALDNDELVVATTPKQALRFRKNLGTAPIATMDLASAERTVVASGRRAKAIFSAGIEEWKLLTAAYLNGLISQALEQAAEYGNERTAFGVKIGTFQGLSHPLAECATDLEGSRLLNDYAMYCLQAGRTEAGALISMAYWQATETACRSMPQCIHIFGGYGVSKEHHIQLFGRRGMAIPNLLGDRQRTLIEIADRAWGNDSTELPDAGETGLNFDPGPDFHAMTERINQFFAEHLTAEFDEFRGHSWDGFHPEIYQKLGSENLLFPAWPEEYGGRNASHAEMFALTMAFYANRWTEYPQITSKLIGNMVLEFGSDALKQEVLPQIVKGEAVACIGLTEPHCGSDVFAAKTKAVRKGDNWLINGQKMFTSGANIGKYVLLLTCTDANAPKHVGKTMFLVPLDHPGVEVHGVDTISAHHTNITYYSNVEIADRYRLGDVNAGSKVLGYMLSLEQGTAPYGYEMKHMLDQAVAWALNTQKDGRLVFDDPLTKARLARAYVDFTVAHVMSLRIVHDNERDMGQRQHSSMLKSFVTEAWKRNSAELLNMAAPDSLYSDTQDLNYLEEGWRSSLAACIYAGTTQVHRSVVAELALGLPRSRN